MGTAPKPILKELMQIPGVGKSIAQDLYNIHVRSISDLTGRNPEELYHLSNQYTGATQDPCVLYTFRCAVYYASTPHPEPDKLKWWYWKEGR